MLVMADAAPAAPPADAPAADLPQNTQDLTIFVREPPRPKPSQPRRAIIALASRLARL